MYSMTSMPRSPLSFANSSARFRSSRHSNKLLATIAAAVGSKQKNKVKPVSLKKARKWSFVCQCLFWRWVLHIQLQTGQWCMRMLLLAKLFCKDLLLLLTILFHIQLLCTKGKPNAKTGMVQWCTSVNKQLMEKIKNVPPPKYFSIHHILQFGAKMEDPRTFLSNAI